MRDSEDQLENLLTEDTVSEWLRRWTRNSLGSACKGSNPFGVYACLSQEVQDKCQGLEVQGKCKDEGLKNVSWE